MNLLCTMGHLATQYYSHIATPHAACPVGTYLSPGSGLCSDCPANSISEEEGLSQCMCIDGYQRGVEQGQKGEDLPCTGKACCTKCSYQLLAEYSYSMYKCICVRIKIIICIHMLSYIYRAIFNSAASGESISALYTSTVIS
jgi:hypothetical protein